MIKIERLDHLVITVADIPRAIAFYVEVLGMQAVMFGNSSTPRHALAFGQQKINLHQAGKEFEPKAAAPTPGSADLCFLTQTPLPDVIDHIQRKGISIIEGPVQRTGALGPILSVYLRDPDQNLIEIANQLNVNP